MIIVTGSIAYDYILDFPGRYGDHILPDQLHKINLSFITKRFEKRRGGTAGNASYCLGHLNTPHILFSYAGKDFTEYKKDFEKVKINTSKVLIDKSTFTATGFAITDKDDNQIWGYFYGAAENNSKLKLKTVAKKGDLVLAGPSGTKATMSIVDQCVKENLDYMFDPGFILTDVKPSELELGIRNAKYIIGNDYEIESIKRRVKNWQKYFAEKIIITTLGKDGALIETPKEKIKIKPVKVKKAVDPTGAGDAWRGGFLAGLERKFDLKTCGQMGALAAGYAVEVYGTQEYKYSIKQFEKRYFENYSSVLNL
jgi:adenosine kinase